jgi:hypothetical protein
VIVILPTAIVLACLFAASYTIALGRPRFHAVPIALVGARSRFSGFPEELEKATAQGVLFSTYATATDAKRAVANQDVYAALVLGPTSSRLFVSSGSGSSVAHALEAVSYQLPATKSGKLILEDLRPLPFSDSQGYVSLYLLFATMLLGFVTTFFLRVNCPELSLRGWLACIALLAPCGGIGAGPTAGPITGGVQGSLPELCAVLAAWIAVCALFARTALTLLHTWAVVATIVVLVIVGIPSSGGAVGRPLLPEFYRVVGAWLPDGATVQLLRNIAYFPENQHLEPVLVLIAWLVGLLGTLVLVSGIQSRHTQDINQELG